MRESHVVGDCHAYFLFLWLCPPQGKLWCKKDYQESKLPKCASCRAPIVGMPLIFLSSSSFSRTLWLQKIADFGDNFFLVVYSAGLVFLVDSFSLGSLYSSPPPIQIFFLPTPIAGAHLKVGDQVYHPEHFVCFVCQKKLEPASKLMLHHGNVSSRSLKAR